MNLPFTLRPAESAERPIAPDPAQVPRAQAWWMRLLSTWRYRALSRSELRRLDARQLRDIGLREEELAHRR